eukprot:tig00001335_g8207.t1
MAAPPAVAMRLSTPDRELMADIEREMRPRFDAMVRAEFEARKRAQHAQPQATVQADAAAGAPAPSRPGAKRCDVCVGFAPEDAPVARRYAARLRAAGFSVRMDRGALAAAQRRPGGAVEAWGDEEGLKASDAGQGEASSTAEDVELEACRAFVFFLSRAFLAAPACDAALQRAHADRSIAKFPVFVEAPKNLDLSAEYRMMLTSVNWTVQGEGEAGADAACNTLVAGLRAHPALFESAASRAAPAPAAWTGAGADLERFLLALGLGALNHEHPYDAFVSYAHKDSELVFQYVEALEKAGLKLWVDRNLTVGRRWMEDIATAMKESKFFVAFLSPNYAASSNCDDELQFAHHQLRIAKLPVYLAPPAELAFRTDQEMILASIRERAQHTSVEETSGELLRRLQAAIEWERALTGMLESRRLVVDERGAPHGIPSLSDAILGAPPGCTFVINGRYTLRTAVLVQQDLRLEGASGDAEVVCEVDAGPSTSAAFVLGHGARCSVTLSNLRFSVGEALLKNLASQPPHSKFDIIRAWKGCKVEVESCRLQAPDKVEGISVEGPDTSATIRGCSIWTEGEGEGLSYSPGACGSVEGCTVHGKNMKAGQSCIDVVSSEVNVTNTSFAVEAWDSQYTVHPVAVVRIGGTATTLFKDNAISMALASPDTRTATDPYAWQKQPAAVGVRVCGSASATVADNKFTTVVTSTHEITKGGTNSHLQLGKFEGIRVEGCRHASVCGNEFTAAGNLIGVHFFLGSDFFLPSEHVDNDADLPVDKNSFSHCSTAILVNVDSKGSSARQAPLQLAVRRNTVQGGTTGVHVGARKDFEDSVKHEANPSVPALVSLHVEENAIEACSVGLSVSGSTGSALAIAVIFKNNTLENIKKHAINTEGDSRPLIEQNTIQDTAAAGTSTSTSTGVRIANGASPRVLRNRIAGPRVGVHVQGFKDIRNWKGKPWGTAVIPGGLVEANTIANCGEHGLLIEHHTTVLVRGNTVEGSGGDAVLVVHHVAPRRPLQLRQLLDLPAAPLLDRYNNGTIRSRRVYSGDAMAVMVRKEVATVEANDISRSGGPAVHIALGADAVVRGNKIHDQKEGVLIWRRGKGTVEGNEFSAIGNRPIVRHIPSEVRARSNACDGRPAGPSVVCCSGEVARWWCWQALCAPLTCGFSCCAQTFRNWGGDSTCYFLVCSCGVCAFTCRDPELGCLCQRFGDVCFDLQTSNCCGCRTGPGIAPH